MSRCCICNSSVSDEAEHIGIGIIRKKYFPVCDKCGVHLKNICNTQLSNDVYENSNNYFQKNSSTILNDGVKNYIEQCNKTRIKKQNKKPRKSRGKIYYVDKMPLGEYIKLRGCYQQSVDVKIPEFCTNCMTKTDKRETITATCTKEEQGFGSKTIMKRSMSLDFPLCEDCITKRKRPGVKITSFTIDFASYGLMFTNGDYAKLFAQVNDKKYSEFEDDGIISAMH